jgi:hypothetical protein
MDVSVAVDHDSPESIAAGVLEIYENQLRMKNSIRRLAAAGQFETFNSASIVDTYVNTVGLVLRDDSQAARH